MHNTIDSAAYSRRLNNLEHLSQLKKNTASKNVISYECGICGNPCTSDYDSIVCDMRGVRFHQECLGLTELSEWICPRCVSIECDTHKGKMKKGRKGIGKCSKFK